jgi:amino acid adenylation domain-containing protein
LSIPELIVPDSARRSLPDPLPLSWSQERVWLLARMNPESTAHSLYAASRVGERLDINRLLDAITRVVRRQESLRTVFPERDGRPCQLVREPVDGAEGSDGQQSSGHRDFELLVESFEGRGEAAAAEAAERARAVMEGGWKLESGPLLRVFVGHLGDEDFLLAVGMHQIISDPASLAIFGRELAAYYTGETSALPETGISYPDYTVWQRDSLAGSALEARLAPWRARLAGLTTLELPLDYPRPPFFVYRGDTLRLDLSRELKEGLERFSANHQTTPFATGLATFGLLLSSYSGQDDIAVAASVANREQSPTTELIGPVANMLVHRNRISSSGSFRELLAEVEAHAEEAFAHREVPFEVIHRELNLPSDASRPVLAQVFFSAEDHPAMVLPLPGLRHEPVSLSSTSARFELEVSLVMDGVQPYIQLTFNTSLFTHKTAERLLRHYRVMLERLVKNPEISLTELRAVPEQDQSLLFDQWNNTARPIPQRLLPELIREQAERRPDEIAVSSTTGSFTYAELVSYAASVTGALQEIGVQPGDRVAVIMRRSRQMLGALIGILGAGATYIPIDPNYPASRVRYVLEDSGATAAVSQGGLERQFDLTVPVLNLTRPSSAEPVDFVTPDPDDAAYIIYTSGSTGKPKGVEIPHSALSNFLSAMLEAPGFTASDRMLSVTTVAFDIAVLEFYLPLVAGGRVVMASEDEVVDGRLLAERIVTEGITVMQATPATWKLMINSGWTGAPGLRVFCGGEPLSRQLADDLLDRASQLWNMYGPTETTVYSTLECIGRDEPILVGRPIANTTLYVLDEQLRLRPIGASGELWIGGAGVARGYINRPDLTAERFIPDPFRPGERIYRTGDLVRFRNDGRVEHLGRLDNQVKVRGFRIELGEVEAALLSHPAVRDAVVMAVDDRLVGYVVMNNGADASSSELRSWAGTTLPPYMVPSLYVTLDSLPLTPNGKVDRKALPTARSPEPEPFVADSGLNPMERRVAEIWAKLIGIASVSPGDNFFEIGGHSLLAIEVVAAIEEQTGYRLEPRSLFFMTLSEVAALITSSTSGI